MGEIWQFIKIINYINIKEIVSILDKIYNHRFYDEYYKLFKEIRDYSKEHNCPIENIECCDYPEEIEWW